MQEHTSQTEGKGTKKTHRNSCVNLTRQIGTHTNTLLKSLLMPLTSSLIGYTSSWRRKKEKEDSLNASDIQV